MKLMKRALALLLCFLMLTNGPISAFATEGTDDVVVETTTTETVETCEECGGSDAHTETCSLNTVALLTTEAPDETTEPTTTPTEETTEPTEPATTPTVVTEPTVTTGPAISTDPVGCTECNQTEGHLDTCSQYVAPTEETTEPTVSGNDVVACTECGATEGHNAGCSQYVDPNACTECKQVDGHAETCSQYEAPVEGITETTGPQVGDKIWIRHNSYVYKNQSTENGHKLLLNYEVEIVNIITDENGNALWYEFKFTTVGIGEWLIREYKYVQAENTSVEEPDATVPGEIESSDGTVGISGNLPDGASVTVDVPDDETMIEIMDKIFPDMGEFFSWVEFFDISIESEGSKWQPGENVTITLDTTDIQDDQEVKVYHILDDQAAIQRAIDAGSAQSYIDENENTIYYTVLSSEDDEVIVNEDGTISFETDSFSTFIVQGFGDDTDAEDIGTNATVHMVREEVKYFKHSPADNQGTWKIGTGSDVIRIEIYNSNQTNGQITPTTTRWSYMWVRVTALKPGTATVEYHANGVNTPEDTLTIIVDPDTGWYIDDQISQNGCLVPKHVESSIDLSQYTFEWTRSDGKSVSSVALETPYASEIGAVNIAMDRGGVDASDRAMKTYTLTVKSGDTKLAEMSHQVPYGNEVINGSFEYPIIDNPTSGVLAGADGVFWKTTNTLGSWDIEYINNNLPGAESTLKNFGFYRLKGAAPTLTTVTGQNMNGTSYQISFSKSFDNVEYDGAMADGNQAAELNAGDGGAIYQDVLTYPGSHMYWSLAHRARQGGGIAYAPKNGNMYDNLYVVVASSEDAKNIVTKSQVQELIKAANKQYGGKEHTAVVDGNEITFCIWNLQTDHTAWVYYDNEDSPYVVPEGQYLTRYFFATGFHDDGKNQDIDYWNNWNKLYYADVIDAALHDHIDDEVGNYVDDVEFNDKMPWRIEYYKNGALVAELNNESGTVELPRDTMRYELNHAAQNMNHQLLSDTTLVRTEINGRAYGGTTLDWVGSNHNVLQLYYESYGVNVTKKVEISNYDSLSNEDKTRIDDLLEYYTFSFSLYEQNSDIAVATATVKIDPDTFYGTATFTDSNGKFNPNPDKSYVIKEDNLTEIPDLIIKKKADDTSFSNTRVFAFTATNVYEVNVYGDLTITKTGADSKDENQSFIFRVTGPDSFSMDVIIVGNGSTTVKHLPAGDYVVHELTGWSWRYDEVASDPANGTVSLTSHNKQGTVTFTNSRTNRFWLSGDSYCENWWGNNGNVIRKDEDE